jgi:hypothetical protein
MTVKHPKRFNRDQLQRNRHTRSSVRAIDGGGWFGDARPEYGTYAIVSLAVR